jgi:SAM-dependent methyltransferase
MLRQDEPEMLDDTSLPQDLVNRAYRDMASIHRWLGDVRFMVRAIRADSTPVRRILDVGCGTGLVLQRVGRALNTQVVGVDIRPGLRCGAPVPIVRVDACRDPLPDADVAFCMYVCHHLDPEDLSRMIRNVGRYCRRFILLDLVRHPLPLALFRMFVAPLVCQIDAQDGQRSIRRSYTPAELREITAAAVEGSPASFRVSVAPGWIRQVVDISYGPRKSDSASPIEFIPEEDRCLR